VLLIGVLEAVCLTRSKIWAAKARSSSTHAAYELYLLQQHFALHCAKQSAVLTCLLTSSPASDDLYLFLQAKEVLYGGFQKYLNFINAGRSA
jgi:hypothetical protein